MKRLKAWTLWILDVFVGVFIGPVDWKNEHGRTIRRVASRRSTYAFIFVCCTVLFATAYILAGNWL